MTVTGPAPWQEQPPQLEPIKLIPPECGGEAALATIKEHLRSGAFPRGLSRIIVHAVNILLWPHQWRKMENLCPPYRVEVEVYCPTCEFLTKDVFDHYADEYGGKHAEWDGCCACEQEWEWWRPLVLPGEPS